MQYTGTVAMFNSQLRRDRVGGLQEEQRPANNMVQSDLPQKKIQRQSRRRHGPERTAPSRRARVAFRAERQARLRELLLESLYYYLDYVPPAACTAARRSYLRDRKEKTAASVPLPSK